MESQEPAALMLLFQLMVALQDDNNAPIAKATASTPPSEAGYILEYEHGQVRNGTMAIVGST